MAKKNSSKKKTSRTYPNRDLKQLWGLSSAVCAFPNCKVRVIQKATKKDAAAIIGEIAHIRSHSDNGPRANPKLTPKERDCYDNWILLCSNHHSLVDQQSSTYTEQDLKKWKKDHEAWVDSKLMSLVSLVSFVELQKVTQAIISAKPAIPTSDFSLTPPKKKIQKNNLSANIEKRISMGMSKSKDVKEYIKLVSKTDSEFAERLKSGFLVKYKELQDEGYDGDSLFRELHMFASGQNMEFDQQAAGLAVLVYFFENCEVFEK